MTTASTQRTGAPAGSIIGKFIDQCCNDRIRMRSRTMRLSPQVNAAPDKEHYVTFPGGGRPLEGLIQRSRPTRGATAKRTDLPQALQPVEAGTTPWLDHVRAGDISRTSGRGAQRAVCAAAIPPSRVHDAHPVRVAVDLTRPPTRRRAAALLPIEPGRNHFRLSWIIAIIHETRSAATSLVSPIRFALSTGRANSSHSPWTDQPSRPVRATEDEFGRTNHAFPRMQLLLQ